MKFRDSTGMESALEQGLNQAPQAVIQLGSPLIRQAGSRVAGILSARRIPGISQFRTSPDGGGLMSYGPDLIALYRRVGPQISKVAPWRQPSRFANRTAHQVRTRHQSQSRQSIECDGSRSLLAVADEVIE